MPILTAKMRTVREPDPLGRSLQARIRRIVTGAEAAAKVAAVRATEVSRESFHYKRPPNAPPRRGREARPGALPDALRWLSRGTTGYFDLAYADAHARFWIIQEIGTGQRATLKQAGIANPEGRSKKGASYVKTVKPQAGRRISPALAWGTGPGGEYRAPGAETGQQLYLASSLQNAPGRPSGMSIRLKRPGPNGELIENEIQGQHMVRLGGEQGYRIYHDEVIAAARRAFVDRGRRL